MNSKDLKGCNVKLYLEGGHTITGEVLDVTFITTIVTGGGCDMHEALVLLLNGHTTMIRFDKVIVFEVW